jgi:Tfp pilus assembly protein PilP
MRGVLAIALVILPAGLGWAQAPAAAPPPPTADRAAASPAPPPENYSYEPDGRRDPFMNLLNTGADPRPVGTRGEGVAGMTVAEISVRGVLQSRGSLVAMVRGPDNKTYLVHEGDRLMDGTIKSITPQGLIILQEVNDPLSLVKQREVRKMLRSMEDGKA